MSRRPAAASALLASLLLCISCSSTPGGQGGESTAPTSASPGGTPTATPSPVETDATLAPRPAPAGLEAATPVPSHELDASRGRLYCPKGTHEGCHGPADMPSYLGHAVAVTAPLFDANYGVENRPAASFFVPAGVTGPTACVKDDGTPEEYTSQDYSYCTEDKAIYVGQDALWMLYNGVGGAAPAVGYAHEWGHHIQNIKGVPAPETEEENMLLENQADCISGAWAAHAEQAGNLAYPGDLGDINAMLAGIAPPGEGETGSPIEDRANAFMQGYTNGLPGCNSYFPETPIYAG
ncbi:neutral zinc metallopeptidase [uncultured Arthrobacter sp.]|uniref:neutral zinc metallopeptidase n=1 Tax=uncultured Arthrobacter sp. TaxID=114050 RepID=UPI003216D079